MCLRMYICSLCAWAVSECLWCAYQHVCLSTLTCDIGLYESMHMCMCVWTHPILLFAHSLREREMCVSACVSKYVNMWHGFVCKHVCVYMCMCVCVCEPSLPNYLPIAGEREREREKERERGCVHTFTKGISTKWNAIILVQDLNTGRRFHFLRW